MAVTENFDSEFTPRMLIGRSSHADLYEKKKALFHKPNMKMRIRFSRNTEPRTIKFFKCLKKNHKLGLFMHDFKDKRLLLYLHPPSHSNIAGKEIFATKLLEVQQHKLNFMLGRFKHDTESKTLARHLARLLHSLPKPANARIHFMEDPSKRIVLTFARELKLFNREHVASLFRQKGELLLSIAGEILVLTKNEKCSVTIISTKRYEQKLQDAQMAIS